MARSIWSGTISFGLVSIPIRLFSAVQEKKIRFHLLTPDGSCRLRQKLYCPETQQDYNFSETARGYEIAPDQYVIVDEKELEKIEPQKGDDIEIQQFIDLDEVDPIFFNKSYLVLPDKKAGRPYQLLYEVMREKDKAGVAKMVMRDKEHLVLIRAGDRVLYMFTLYFAGELRTLDELDFELPHQQVARKDLSLALQLVEALTSPFRIEKYKDETTIHLKKFLERRKSKKIPSAISGKRGQTASKVVDLTERLQASLKRGGRTKTRQRRAG